MRGSRAAASWLACWICLCGSAPPGASGSGESVRQVIESGIAWSGLTGVAVAILRDGELVHQSTHGHANVELGVPVTPTTLFQLSSTTKLFTATAAMLFVEQGRLDLDASVRVYLPELPDSWPGVRVRHLLSHLSGLPEVLECEAPDVREALTCVTALPPEAPPGARFRYNQTNYLLVQRILETLAGQPLAEILRELLFRPAEMRSTVHEGSSTAVVPGRATSYYPDGAGGLRIREFDFPPFLLAAAGLNSSLEDLIRWDRALHSGGLVTDGSIETMWRQPELGDGRLSRYALGWSVRHHPGGRRSVGHEGGGLTTLRRYVDDRLTVILLTNGSRYRFDPDELADALAAVFVPDLRPAEVALLERMRSAWSESGRGVEASLAAYRSFLSLADGATRGTEEAVNRFGYDLLERSRPAAAVRVFRLNIGRYPESSNAYDSLGEGLAAAGEIGEAIRHYRESLRLDPSNGHAEKMLKELAERLARSGGDGAGS